MNHSKRRERGSVSEGLERPSVDARFPSGMSRRVSISQRCPHQIRPSLGRSGDWRYGDSLLLLGGLDLVIYLEMGYRRAPQHPLCSSRSVHLTAIYSLVPAIALLVH